MVAWRFGFDEAVGVGSESEVAEQSGLAAEILGRSLFFYRLLRWLIRVATQVFFRRIEVSGRADVPDDGAVIFCGNHPNSLLDPILITAYCGRIVHFAAKDVLFKNPIMRPLMRVAGAVPVMRRKDHVGKSVDNTAMFDTMYGVLAAGRATGIFPEGISHDRSQLAPLKTGAARMAMGLKQRHPDSRVYLVPTGLVYLNRSRFRSNVLIQFGDAVEIDDEWMGRFEGDQSGAARELTEHIDGRIRALTINADHWNRVWVLDGVRRLYQPPKASLEERVRVARRFNLGFPHVQDDPDVRALYRRVEAYLMRQSSLGVDDRALRGEMRASRAVFAFLGHLVLLLFYLPLFLVGAPIHVPLGLLLKLAGRTISPRSDVVATTKFLLGFLSILLVYGAVTTVAWWRFGAWAGALALVLLPASGWATVKVFGRAYALRHAFLTGFRLATLRREVRALRAERKELVERVVEQVEIHRNVADAAEAELHTGRVPL